MSKPATPEAEVKPDALPPEIWEILNHWTPNGFARQDIIQAYWAGYQIGKGETECQ